VRGVPGRLRRGPARPLRARGRRAEHRRPARAVRAAGRHVPRRAPLVARDRRRGAGARRPAVHPRRRLVPVGARRHLRDRHLPSEGFRGVGQITFASRALGGDYEYSRYLVQVETAFGVGRLPLRLQAALGAAQGEAPFFERFYPADYSYFAIGPALGRALELNFSTDSRYDAFLAMGGAEYAAKLWARGGFFRRAYLALGVRGVWSNGRLGGTRTSYSASPASADVALRLDTPVGVFNLSLGYAVDIFW
jgi:hypothetical protein